MMSDNLDQKCAARAWLQASTGVRSHGKTYVVLAKGAPALIMSNGLMQTLSYYQAKAGNDNKKPHGVLLEHIIFWLAEQLGGSKLANGETYPSSKPGFEPTMQALFHADSDLYRQATREALSLLRWIRQFAAAVDKDGLA